MIPAGSAENPFHLKISSTWRATSVVFHIAPSVMVHFSGVIDFSTTVQQISLHKVGNCARGLDIQTTTSIMLYVVAG